MLGSENARRDFIDIDGRSFAQRFFEQRGVGGQKLHRPVSNDDVTTFHFAAASFQIIEDWLQTNELFFRSRKGDENIYVERRDRFEIKGRADSTANRVALNHAISLHAIDRLDHFVDRHGTRMSSKRR